MNNPKPANSNNSSSPTLSSFIETLKQKQQASPDRFPPFSFPEIRRTKQLETQRIEQFHQARNKEWEGVYSAKQKQIEKRIIEIREQLKLLIEKIVRFDFNIEQAISSATPEPGEYHIGFLEHIKAIIELLKKNISEADSWLSLYNQRSKKVSHYWGMAKKKGSQYTLSQERQMATSVG